MAKSSWKHTFTASAPQEDMTESEGHEFDDLSQIVWNITGGPPYIGAEDFIVRLTQRHTWLGFKRRNK